MTQIKELELRDGRRARIRPATVADADALIALDHVLAEDGRGMVLAASQGRTPEEERRRIDDIDGRVAEGGASLIVVTEVAAVVLGSAELRQLSPARCRHVGVLSLGVHPGAQRLGIGRALLRYLIAHARDFGLERLELYVRRDNARARALYESEELVLEGVRARFVRLDDGSYVDDLVMVRFLSSGG